jgi:ABC-type branched-subunit amino acid transport system substrate-binding protein
MDIVVGQVAPMQGPNAIESRAYTAGMELVFRRANKSGGVNGNKFVLTRVDDSGRPEETVRATAQLLAQSKPMVLAGYFGNDNVTELLSSGILERERIALVGYRSWEIRTESPLLYSVRAGLREEIERIFQYLATIGITRIGLLHEPDRGSANLISAAQAAARGARATIVSQASYAPGSAQAASAVKALVDSPAQAIIIVTSGAAAASFIEQYRAAGGTAQLFTHSGVDIEQMSRRLSESQLQSVAIAQVTPNPYTISTRAAKELNDLANENKPELPVSFAMMEGFITARVIVEAARRQGNAPTREGFVAALDSLRSFDIGDYVVGFRPDRHTGSNYVELSIIGRAGRLRQ